MNARRLRPAARVAVAATLLWLAVAAGCGGGGDGEGGGIGGTGVTASGTLRVELTDAPACGYDAVHVTIERVRVHAEAGAADDGGGWSDVVVAPARRIDLLTLTGGRRTLLGETELPPGRYSALRLLLVDNDAAQPYANAVTPTGAAETPLDTPSATTAGLKMQTRIDVEPGRVTDFVLDFDACRSIVPRGNSGRYNLWPVIAVQVSSPADRR